MSKNAGSLFMLIGLLAGLALLAWIGALLVARLVRRRLADRGGDQPFTLQDLRDLRAQGMITEAEFQSMRAAILGRYAALEPGGGERGEGGVDIDADLRFPDEDRDGQQDDDRGPEAR